MAHIAPFRPFHSYVTGEPDVSPEMPKSLKMRFEFSYWEADVLPLNYARVCKYLMKTQQISDPSMLDGILQCSILVPKVSQITTWRQ